MAGARERKRADRRKRKRRSGDQPVPADTEGAASPQVAPGNGAASSSETFQERMARRYEERNEETRAKLEPLEKGERPRAVTVGAVVSTVLAVVISVQAVLSLAGVSTRGATTRPAPLILFAVVLWAMAIGMWRTRYWAVLGFQTILLLTMLASAFGLVIVSSVLQAVGTTLLLLGSGLLFYFMIRAMARIQMPEPPGAD